MLKIITLTALLFSSVSFAKNYLDENLKKLNWNGIEVIWLEDNQLPLYDIAIYFNDGALGDPKGKAGTSELMFSQLTSGTNRYTQKEIIESLEFYGVSYGSHATHEYSTFEVNGLVKDYVPTMKMICHLFNQAIFPVNELKKIKRRMRSSMKSIVTDHGALTNQVFRKESLRGTGYDTPVSGNLKSLGKIFHKDLAKRLGEYNQKVAKRIYIKGPSSILGIKSIFENDCKWKKVESKKILPTVKNIAKDKKIIFIPMAKANQAQIRIGRVLTTDEVAADNNELKSMSAKFMGGGFTSRLVQGLRVKKGLTYSAGAYASEQKMYGRSGISTFTRDEAIVEMLNSIKSIIEENSQNIGEDIFTQSKRNIKGNYLLGLESSSEFLKNLMMFDHINKDYSEIYQFPAKIDAIKSDQLKEMIKGIFDWDKQTIVILGSEKVKKSLKKAGFPLKIVNYKDYL